MGTVLESPLKVLEGSGGVAVAKKKKKMTTKIVCNSVGNLQEVEVESSNNDGGLSILLDDGKSNKETKPSLSFVLGQDSMRFVFKVIMKS